MHDESRHAKCLTSQFTDTLGTKSDYELQATINRAQCFIKQFIVHKNDKTYLSDRVWRAVLWAACWKKGQRCLFNILAFKLCAQSILKKKNPVSPTFFAKQPNMKLLVTQQRTLLYYQEYQKMNISEVNGSPSPGTPATRGRP